MAYDLQQGRGSARVTQGGSHELCTGELTYLASMY